MRGSKLDLVKQAIKFMVQQLSSTDRLSVVSFDAQASKSLMYCFSFTSFLSSLHSTLLQPVYRLEHHSYSAPYEAHFHQKWSSPEMCGHGVVLSHKCVDMVLCYHTISLHYTNLRVLLA